MSHGRRRGLLVFLGLSVALWLALGGPGPEFFREAWIPAAGWLVLGFLASLPGEAARAARTDPDTYGMVALAWGSTTAGLGALLAAAALVVARYVTTPGSRWGEWATSPVLGAVFVLALLAVVFPMMATAERSPGDRGSRPVEDGRDDVRSHPPPPKRRGDGHGAGRAGD